VHHVGIFSMVMVRSYVADTCWIF